MHLKHYTIQAWEVYMRKFMRRASPGSRAFKPQHELSIDRPDPDWTSKMASRCVGTDTVLDDRIACMLSSKAAAKAACAAHDAASTTSAKGPLIVAVGGTFSGLDWLQQQFRMGGLRANVDLNELFSVDETGTDLGLRRPASPTGSATRPLARYRAILHAVRDPLAVIAALVRAPAGYWTELRDQLGFAMTDAAPLKRGLHAWVILNSLVELIADWRFRIESTPPSDLCAHDIVEDAPSMTCSPEWFQPWEESGRGRDRRTTWQELEAEDPGVAKLARTLAERYGYTYEG